MDNLRLTYLTQNDSDAIPNLVSKLEAQRAASRDYIYPAVCMAHRDDNLVMSAQNSFRVGDRMFTEWGDAEEWADKTGGQVVHDKDSRAALRVSRNAFAQMRNALSIPAKYVETLRADKQLDLLDHNVTRRLANVNKRYLVRTMQDSDGTQFVRAFLSDRYRMLDHADLFFAAADAMNEWVDGKPRASIWKARLTDDKFELFAVSPAVQGLVRTDRPDGRHISHHINPRPVGEDDPGDAYFASVCISNSETGRGGCSVSLATFCKACTNFAIYDKALTRIHLGGTNEADGLVFSSKTLEAESKVTWLKVQDAVRTAFDPAAFQKVIDRLNNATQIVMGKPEAAVDHLVKRYDVSEARKADILAAIHRSNDFSGYGLIQAVTAVGREVQSEDPDTASQLEHLGGTLTEDEDALKGIAVAC